VISGGEKEIFMDYRNLGVVAVGEGKCR
jgi:hypothetical protein